MTVWVVPKASLNVFTDSGPMSSPIQPSGMADAGTICSEQNGIQIRSVTESIKNVRARTTCRELSCVSLDNKPCYLHQEQTCLQLSHHWVAKETLLLPWPSQGAMLPNQAYLPQPRMNLLGGLEPCKM